MGRPLDHIDAVLLKSLVVLYENISRLVETNPWKAAFLEDLLISLCGHSTACPGGVSGSPSQKMIFDSPASPERFHIIPQTAIEIREPKLPLDSQSSMDRLFNIFSVKSVANRNRKIL